MMMFVILMGVYLVVSAIEKADQNAADREWDREHGYMYDCDYDI